MFDGKIFFGVTGTPIRKTALVNSALADAEPVPLTLANLITKSLIFTYSLFFSSQAIGSQSSTLLPSGSMIQANLPFSCDSGPE